jgi:hypothetical protein
MLPPESEHGRDAANRGAIVADREGHGVRPVMMTS